MVHRHLPLVLDMANSEWRQPEELQQWCFVNPQPSKHRQKWMLPSQVCFDIWELPLSAVCRWRMLTFWWTALILSLWRTTSVSFYRKISPKPSTEQNCTRTTGKRARPSCEENLDLWLFSQIKIMSDSGMLPFLCEDSNHEGFVKPECSTHELLSVQQKV